MAVRRSWSVDRARFVFGFIYHRESSRKHWNTAWWFWNSAVIKEGRGGERKTFWKKGIAVTKAGKDGASKGSWRVSGWLRVGEGRLFERSLCDSGKLETVGKYKRSWRCIWDPVQKGRALEVAGCMKVCWRHSVFFCFNACAANAAVQAVVADATAVTVGVSKKVHER